MRGDNPDRTCLSWWFPRIQALGLPVPRTLIIREPEVHSVLFALCWGEVPDMGPLKSLEEKVREAAQEIGWPIFLRTGQTSAKHLWEDTCFVNQEANLLDHIVAIAEYGFCADFLGLSADVWAVREYLPGPAPLTAPGFGNMPIRHEIRVFATGQGITHWQPYWPKSALLQGGVSNSDADKFMADSPAPPQEIQDGSIKAAEACGGEWSIDWLLATGQWVLTDMAEAAQSYRWDPGQSS